MSLPTSRWLSFGLPLTLFVALASPWAQAAEEKESKSKSAKAADSAAVDEVPDGSPKELLEYIKKLQSSQPKGSSRTARMEYVKQVMVNIISASEKIIAAKADDETTAEAVDAELEAVAVQKRLGDEAAGEKLDKLIKEFEQDKRPAIAQAARFYQLLKEKDGLDENSPDDLRAFATKMNEFLLSARLQPRMVQVAAMVVQMIQQVDGPAPAAKIASDLAVAFAKSDDLRVQENASQFAAYAGRLFESDKKIDEAIKNYEKVAKLLAKVDNEDVKASGEKLMGAVRKLKLVGSLIEIKGTLVNGKTFDWSKYKGKVVLVDFWATWCGPCLAELPNVKQTYEKYHDQGFDVVGISLDDDEQTLKEFLEEEQLPWPILFSKDPKATGWEHPMASYYGVSAIPAAILVGRDGKVVTLQARGEELPEKVAELLGADEDDAKPVKKPAKKG